MENQRKATLYARIFDQVSALLVKSNNPIACMATITALLHHKMNFFWTGFYLLHDGRLQVGPYQGALACIDLKKDTGVCWSAIQLKQTVVVQDVHDFPDHIACDSRSKSEIVVPLYLSDGEIEGVLDIDSDSLGMFDETDAVWLEKFVKLITAHHLHG